MKIPKHTFHFGIIGCGAIGIGLAHLLHQHTSTMFVSKAKYDLLAQQAPSILENQQSSTIAASICRLDTASSAVFKQLDLLILPVKHYHLRKLIAQLQGILPASVDLLLLQNGLGGHELIEANFRENTLYLGATTDAIAVQSSGNVKVNARGDLLIGNTASLRPSEAILSLLAAHPKGTWDSNIMSYLYQKLAVNAVINPLTVKFNCRNGEIKQHPEWLIGLKQEVLTLYKNMGVESSLMIDLNEVDSYIDSVIELTADNYSSMYQDVANGRQTEVEGILGILIKNAADHKLQLPMMDSLYSEILQLNKAM